MVTNHAPWHRGAVGYEVYVRSFADASGDGIGDLEGVRRHLDHLVWLGVDAVWITPFYPSGGFDAGYDVTDYTAVSAQHGTLEDFDRLIDEAHQRGLRVLVDIVPNHSSHLHPWFQAAVEDPDGQYRDYYIWRDPKPDGSPPNNWVSHFGGPAWTLEPRSGQYYLHLFLPEQPDLNWTNPAVRREFEQILRFWCKRGVDGFRVDVAYGVAKDPEFRDNPQLMPITYAMEPNEVFEAFDHLHDIEQDHNLEVFEEWRSIASEYDVLLIAEVRTDDPDRASRYTAAGTAFDLVFYLWPGWAPWDPALLVSRTRAMCDRCRDGVAWVLDNHDQSRSVSRYGGGEVGRQRSLAMMTLLASLGGMPFIYQGQELGLEDGQVATADLADPVATRNAGATGRDGSRTVMPWDDGPNNGFGPVTPWLNATTRPPADTVAEQRKRPGSPLSIHRRLLEVRRDHPDIWQEPIQWLESEPTTAALRRGEVVVVANLGPESAEVELGGPGWKVTFTSWQGSVARVDGDRLLVPMETTVILTRG